MRSYFIVTLIPVLCLSLAACQETPVSPNLADTDPVMAEGASKKGNPGGKPGNNDFPTVVRFEVKILSGVTAPVTYDDDLLAALMLDESDLLLDESPVEIDFFGCPDATRVCNELTLVLSGGGTSDRISVLAEPSVQGCLVMTLGLFHSRYWIIS